MGLFSFGGEWIMRTLPVLAATYFPAAIHSTLQRAAGDVGWIVLTYSLACAALLTWVILFLCRKREQKVLAQADADRVALLELASHQLRVPLGTFRWWTEILSDAKSRKDISFDEVVGSLQEGVNRLESIVASLMNADVVASDSAHYKVSVLASLKPLIQKVMKSNERALAQRTLKINMTYEKNLPPVQVDSALFLIVLDELMQNAMSYSPDGTTISIRVSREKDFARIDVADQGYGIPSGEQSRIFTKFVRGSNAAQYKPVGNGLGLYICKGIVERGGGTISLASTLKKGTTVSFTLPLEETEEETL